MNGSVRFYMCDFMVMATLPDGNLKPGPWRRASHDGCLSWEANDKDTKMGWFQAVQFLIKPIRCIETLSPRTPRNPCLGCGCHDAPGVGRIPEGALGHASCIEQILELFPHLHIRNVG